MSSKGPYGKAGKFQGLESERNTDDGNHQKKAGYYVFNGDYESAKNKPDKVANKVHRDFLLQGKNYLITPVSKVS